jgi:uncharacterized Zn-finger protein
MLKVYSEVNIVIILKKACTIKILNKTKKIDCNSLSTKKEHPILFFDLVKSSLFQIQI